MGTVSRLCSASSTSQRCHTDAPRCGPGLRPICRGTHSYLRTNSLTSRVRWSSRSLRTSRLHRQMGNGISTTPYYPTRVHVEVHSDFTLLTHGRLDPSRAAEMRLIRVAGFEQRKLVKQYFKYHNRPTIGHRCIVLLMTELCLISPYDVTLY